MGEFGPGFTGGGISADSAEAISAELFIPDPRSIVIEVPIIHDAVAATALWHIQMEVANVADPHFFLPLIQTDTSSDRFHWYYQPLMIGMPCPLAYYPTNGVETDKALATDASGLCAKAYYIVGGDIAGIMQPRHMYFERYRFSTDGGKHWGNWCAAVIKL